MTKIFLKSLLVFLSILFLSQSFVFAKAKDTPYKILADNNGVYVIEIVDEYKKKEKQQFLQPYVVEDLKTNEDVYKETGASLVVNAGFFDPKNQKTVSFVVIDGQTVLDPNDNESLMNNITLHPYLDKILNRSEFRILEDENGKIIYDIAPHNQEIAEGLKLKHSIQGGPMLLPELRLEEEFFILKRDGKIISESASSLHKYPRTAIGICENKVYLFIATKDAPMSLEDVANLAQKWGMEKAMGFDGGGSTSLDTKELHIISEKENTARKVKSFLILK
jgi:hypothetical protein